MTPGVVRKDKSYPYVMGDLQLRTTGIKLKQMRSNVQQQNIMVVNSGNSPLYTIIESQIPYVSATMVPNILKPNQKEKSNLFVMPIKIKTGLFVSD